MRDQDQLETSAPIQPELRAIDAYDAHEPLIAYARGFGVTTLHTGHGPGALISGQTLIAKTRNLARYCTEQRQVTWVALYLFGGGSLLCGAGDLGTSSTAS